MYCYKIVDVINYYLITIFKKLGSEKYRKLTGQLE